MHHYMHTLNRLRLSLEQNSDHNNLALFSVARSNNNPNQLQLPHLLLLDLLELDSFVPYEYTL